MMPRLSGPSRPPAAGGKPRRLVILLHGLGRRRQRPDRARALLGAAAAGRRVPVAERAVPVRHGALRLPMVQLAGPQPGGGAGRGAGGGADPRRLHRRGTGRSAASPTATGAGRVLARHDDVAVCRPAPRRAGRRHRRLLGPAARAGTAGERAAFAPADPSGSRHRRPARSVTPRWPRRRPRSRPPACRSRR